MLQQLQIYVNSTASGLAVSLHAGQQGWQGSRAGAGQEQGHTVQ